MGPDKRFINCYEGGALGRRVWSSLWSRWFYQFPENWFLNVPLNLICYLETFLNAFEGRFVEQQFDGKIKEDV